MPIKMHNKVTDEVVNVFGFVQDYTCRTKAVTYERDILGTWTMFLVKAEDLEPIESN